MAVLYVRYFAQSFSFWALLRSLLAAPPSGGMGPGAGTLGSTCPCYPVCKTRPCANFSSPLLLRLLLLLLLLLQLLLLLLQLLRLLLLLLTQHLYWGGGIQATISAIQILYENFDMPLPICTMPEDLLNDNYLLVERANESCMAPKKCS